MATEEVGVIAQPAEDEIDARPTKRFFVRMLVRDIELIPAIVDLIDNSVDGAKRLAAAGKGQRKGAKSKTRVSADIADLSSHAIDIRVDSTSLLIKDNCGGIELDRAMNYAFRFGRPDDIEPLEGEVGQFGVGMKRALFKLGQHFVVDTIASKSRFTLDVNVPDWLADETRWAFPLQAAAQGEGNPKKDLKTEINVTDLLPSVAAEFQEESFLARLRTQIEFSHQAALAAGIKLTLNGTKLTSRPPTLLSSKDIKPRVISKRLASNGSKVSMHLYSGFVKLADEGADTDDPDRFSGLGLAGWYVICNGRMLVFADKTRLTGWGSEVADYHPQYRRFRGYVYLTGDSAAMPWNTAKTAVDEDSPVWGEVRKEIVAALREARTAMNKIKREVQSGGAAKSPMTTKLEKAKPTPLAKLPTSKRLVVPDGGSSTPKKRKTAQRIDFEVPQARFEEVAESFGLSQPAAIGKRLFDYYYEREISD